MSNVLSGARAIFKISNQQIAYAGSCSFNINHAHQPIDVLDSLAPKEYTETGYTVDFSCNVFRVANQSSVNLGIRPRLEEILTQPELTCEIVDNKSGATILNIIGVKMISCSGNFDARGVCSENWSFVGLKATDEAGEVNSTI